MICPRCSVGEISEATQECLVCGFSRTGGDVVETSDWNQVDDPILPALERQFSVEGVLRRGSTSRIYLARDQVTGRLCSLKVLPLPDELPTGMIERFRKDAQRAAALDHPHLVSLLSYGATDTAVWYAMEYVQGRSLGDLLRTADRMDLKSCLRLVEQIASALEYGHRRGITHGNLKPANVLVDPESWARVADFGVNAAFGPLPRRAPEQSIEENYGHVAPEQFGAAGELGPAADQYALAVLAFDCLARRPPFVGDTLEEITRHHVEGPVPLIAESRPDLPAYVSSALARAMSHAPADRFASVLDFVTALAGVASPLAEPSPAEPPAVSVAASEPVAAAAPLAEIAPAPAAPTASAPEPAAAPAPTAEPAPEAEPAPVRAVTPEPPALEPAAAVTESAPVAAAVSTEAPAAEPAGPPVLFVDRGNGAHHDDEDDEDDEEVEDDEEQARAHEQAQEPEPVLLWPGPRETDAAAAPAAEAALASAPAAPGERPLRALWSRISPQLKQAAQQGWRLAARWRALPRNTRYGSSAAAAVLLLALVWLRVAHGNEERKPGGPPDGFVNEPAPVGMGDSATSHVPHPVTRGRTPPPATPLASGTTRPAPKPPADSAKPTAPPAGAAEPAHLLINSTPWGVLYIDGRQIGNLPQAGIVDVPPGMHTIRILRDGFLPYENVITIESGERWVATDIVLQEKPQ